jgi:hypothetical protein
MSVTIPSGAALSEALDIRSYEKGYIILPSAWTAANIGFQVSTGNEDTFVILRAEGSANPLQITNLPTAASRAFTLPAELFSVPFIKLWSKSTTAATETDTNQAADRLIEVNLQ